MPKIDREHILGRFLDHMGCPQEIGDGAVAVPGRGLRCEHRIVDVEPATGEAAQRVADGLEGIGAPGLQDEAATGDRTGIDHRIERMVVGIEPDRVEGVSRRLDADDLFDCVGAERVQREREDERLRHRLDRKWHAAVADLVDVAIECREADAEMHGVGLAELWNVVGDRAVMVGPKIGVAGGEEALQRRHRRGRPMLRIADGPLVVGGHGKLGGGVDRAPVMSQLRCSSQPTLGASLVKCCCCS